MNLASSRRTPRRRHLWSVLSALVSLQLAASVGAAESGSSIVAAVKSGDASAVQRLLQRPAAEVNAAEPDGTTALHWAVDADNGEIVTALVRARANVNARNRYGVTPLSLACTNGNASIVNQLLSAGADANAVALGGETPLMTAARTGDPEVLRRLLAAGADANARESARGQTALMWAADQGNADAIKVLVAAGADLHAKSKAPASAATKVEIDGRSPYYWYHRENRIDSLTPLLFAVRAGRQDAVRTLLDAGSSIDEVAEDGTGALVLAIANGHFELAGLMLDRGARPDAAEQGWTALHQLARNRTFSPGRHPHPVTTGKLGSLALAEKLLDKGADVNARMTKEISDEYRHRFNHIGATPLLMAAKGLDLELVQLLLSRGADPSLTNKNQTTVLMLAAGVEMSNANEDSGLVSDAPPVVALAIKQGSDVNAANTQGDTPLHGAAARGSTDLIQLLVDKGARLDARNKRGLTALQVANGGSGGNEYVFPEAIALLTKLMTERGLPIELKAPSRTESAQR